MKQLMRFGRRVPLPSTVQIVHDLLVLQQQAKEAKDTAGRADPVAPIGESAPPRVSETSPP